MAAFACTTLAFVVDIPFKLKNHNKKRTYEQLATMNILLTALLALGSRTVRAELQPGGACPLFVLLPFSST